MIARADLIAEARTWLGTPYHHQQALKGVGVDCVGLVRGVCAALGMCSVDMNQIPGAQQFTGYGPAPDGKKLMAALDKFTARIQVADALPGDVFVLTWHQFPQHVGFFADYLHGGHSIIHALGIAGGGGRVVEHRLDARTMGMIDAAYRLPGVA